MRARRLLVTSCLVTVLAGGLAAQRAPARGGIELDQPADLNQWLSFIASDELEGRQIYTEGLGLAAAYIADHLKEWGVKPGGDNGSYFQTVKVLGVRSQSKASVTVVVNGEKRTFKDGEGITFPRNMGGKQTIDGDQIQFVGYGLQIPSAGIDDYAGVDPKGKIVIYLGQQGPKTVPGGSFRLLAARARSAVEKGAAAVIGVPGVRIRTRTRRPPGLLPLRRRTPRLSAPPVRLRLSLPSRHASTSGSARRARPGQPAGRRRFHDGAAIRSADRPGAHRAGRVLRVPVQRVHDAVRGAEGQGREVGAAAGDGARRA